MSSFAKTMFIENPGTPLTSANPEFQAVILSGYGSRMYPLTEESNLPKALLPIANKPMIYFPLQWLEKSNITDVIIAAFPGAKSGLWNYVQELYESNMNIQVVEVPEGCGSADALRHLKISGSLITNFLVISCDLMTDIPPHIVINHHRTLNNTLTCFFFDASNLEPADRLNKEQGEIVGLDPKTCTLLLSIPRADVVDDEICLKRSMLTKFPHMQLYSGLRDSHLYIFKHWVLELLVKNKGIASIKNDLVPLLLECQYRDRVLKREGISSILEAHSKDIFEKARMLSLSNNHIPKVSCSVVVHRQGFTARANTVWSYSEMNRNVVKNLSTNTFPDTCEIAQKTQVGNDCLLGESIIIAEKSSIKRSIIGNHVNIAKNCKITNCIIMDYVVIEEGVKLENTIVCKGAKISAKCELRDCEVAGAFIVPPRTHAKGEPLTNFMDE